MANKKNILILCSYQYHRQPRVLRTIEALAKDYAITVAGHSDAGEHHVNFIDLSHNAAHDRPKNHWHFNKPFFVRLPVSFYHRYMKQKRYSKTLFFEQQYWTTSRKADLRQLQDVACDLVISHGVDTLPLAVKLSQKNLPVIFNAHEYYPLEFEQDPHWLRTEGAKADYLVKKYLPQCVHMFCVSRLIQEKFQEQVKINSTVITNAPNYFNLGPQPVDPGKIRLIHHGVALRERDIEHMASVIDHLDERFELNIMLTVADQAYYDALKEKLSRNRRIRFLPAAPLDTLCEFLNQFDIGYYILPPVNFNTTYALPNKLFEYVQARLCLAFGPSPEMSTVIGAYNLGVVADDYTPAAVAAKIKALSPEAIYNYKQNSHRHAHELSAESNRVKIKQVVDTQFLN